MTSVALPALPLAATVTPRLVSASSPVGGNSGGSIQRIVRLGARWALDVQLPPMEKTDAANWLAAIAEMDTLGSRLTLTWPQPTVTVGGAPVVDGAGQSGATLNVRGLGAGGTIPKFAFFSGAVSGRQYLYATRAAVTADGTGRAAVPIAPLLRASFMDGAALGFATAQVEGYLDGTEFSWTLDRLTWFGISFTLREDK